MIPVGLLDDEILQPVNPEPVQKGTQFRLVGTRTDWVPLQPLQPDRQVGESRGSVSRINGPYVPSVRSTI